MDKYTILKEYFGYESFRGKQEEIIDGLMANKDLIAILPTGAGKSLCFQIPALLKEGVTIVISPLISLMVDQVLALKALKIKACYLNSSLDEALINDLYLNISLNRYKLIYISPERLNNPFFLKSLKNLLISQIIVDEAHCISMWQDDFRPSYKEIKPFIDTFKSRPVIALFTATANIKVIEDIKKSLALKTYLLIKGNSDRVNLFYGVFKPRDKFQLLVKLLLKRPNKCAIIYCLTRRRVLEVHEALKKVGIKSAYYHGGLTDLEKDENQRAFLSGKVGIMVATNAFGMGINKKDIRLVIIYDLPLSLADLAQQMGRAGRDNLASEAFVFYKKEDIKTCEYFIDNKELSLRKKYLLYQELEQVINFCQTKECLHRYLVKYFDGILIPNCNNCTNCLKNKF